MAEHPKEFKGYPPINKFSPMRLRDYLFLCGIGLLMYSPLILHWLGVW